MCVRTMITYVLKRHGIFSIFDAMLMEMNLALYTEIKIRIDLIRRL